MGLSGEKMAIVPPSLGEHFKKTKKNNGVFSQAAVIAKTSAPQIHIDYDHPFMNPKTRMAIAPPTRDKEQKKYIQQGDLEPGTA